MVRRRSQWVEEIRGALGADVAALVLFGSRARGTAFDDSDTDLAVFLRPGTYLRREHYQRLTTRALSEPDVSVVVIATNAARPSGFLLELARGYRVLWQREPGWVDRFLAELQARAIASGARRHVTPSGDPYWVGV